MCIYGYSLTTFLPITGLCFIKSSLIQTVLLFAAFFFSTAFLIRGILSYYVLYKALTISWAKNRREFLLYSFLEFRSYLSSLINSIFSTYFEKMMIISYLISFLISTDHIGPESF